jgi:SNF2 family DNA or RNA helicase
LDAATDKETQTLTRPRIFVTNYEAMEMADLHALLCQWQPEILICDESHKLKSIKSKRAGKVIDLLGEEAVIGSNPPKYTRKVRHVYELTGTPVLNSAMDIFNQYRILDSGDTFGRNFYEFRGRYFEDENAGMPAHLRFPKWIERPESYAQLSEKMYRKAHRALKKDCLDLPDIVFERLHVELGKEQRRYYEEMKAEYITFIKAHKDTDEPRAVVAQMAITKALRLQQIVSGFCKTEDGTEVEIKDNPRLAVTAELLEELTPRHKVIIWASFKRNYKQLARTCEERGIEYVELHGGIPTAVRNENIKRYQKDPKCRVVIANQHAAGIGVNLVEHASIVGPGGASYALFYSRNFSYEDDTQAQSRNHRGGAEVYEKITRIDLVAPGTIDELGLAALAAKKQVADLILDWAEKL